MNTDKHGWESNNVWTQMDAEEADRRKSGLTPDEHGRADEERKKRKELHEWNARIMFLIYPHLSSLIRFFSVEVFSMAGEVFGSDREKDRCRDHPACLPTSRSATLTPS
jgi:hypothetical protein